MHMVRAEYEQRLREIEARVAAQKIEDKKHRELIVQLIDAGYRAMAKTLHPDMGGSHEDMTRLSTVRDELRRGPGCRLSSESPRNASIASHSSARSPRRTGPR
jgi:hypothetical protein